MRRRSTLLSRFTIIRFRGLPGSMASTILSDTWNVGGGLFFFLSILNVDGANEVCNNVVDGAVVSVSSRDVCCFWKLSIQNDEAADAWQLNSSFYLFIFVTEDAFKEPARSFSLFLSLFCPYLHFLIPGMELCYWIHVVAAAPVVVVCYWLRRVLFITNPITS